ncbi:hypothetical protein M422DRAFT_133407, partial [Sphaerobolus stellatus SS14]
MPATDSAPQCPTLTGPEEYQRWKLRIKSILNREKVGDTLLGNITLPAPGDRGSDTWEIRDAKAHGIITQYISDQLLLDLASETTAQGLFNAIVKIFEKTNIGVTTFYIFISMMNIQWDGELPISQHISAISAANARLVSMKKG